jgi:hypothetical protein
MVNGTRTAHLTDMRTTKSTKEGWTKIGRKHYRHDATKVEVRYNCNGWNWDVIGGKADGSAYGALWVAMQAAAGTKAEWV